jgi:hypothetical protein
LQLAELLRQGHWLAVFVFVYGRALEGGFYSCSASECPEAFSKGTAQKKQ